MDIPINYKERIDITHKKNVKVKVFHKKNEVPSIALKTSTNILKGQALTYIPIFFIYEEDFDNINVRSEHTQELYNDFYNEPQNQNQNFKKYYKDLNFKKVTAQFIYNYCKNSIKIWEFYQLFLIRVGDHHGKNVLGIPIAEELLMKFLNEFELEERPTSIVKMLDMSQDLCSFLYSETQNNEQPYNNLFTDKKIPNFLGHYIRDYRYVLLFFFLWQFARVV